VLVAVMCFSILALLDRNVIDINDCSSNLVTMGWHLIVLMNSTVSQAE